MLACSFGPIYAYFQRITLPSSVPFVPHIQGRTARTPLPFPLPSACLRFNREKKKSSELGFLHWRPLASNWCAFMQPTGIVRSTQATRRFLRSVCILSFCFRIRSRPERTHTSYLLIFYLCIFTCSIISVSCDISHDIGIEISRTYSRY